jgi:hypothetical protein
VLAGLEHLSDHDARKGGPQLLHGVHVEAEGREEAQELFEREGLGEEFVEPATRDLHGHCSRKRRSFW